MRTLFTQSIGTFVFGLLVVVQLGCTPPPQRNPRSEAKGESRPIVRQWFDLIHTDTNSGRGKEKLVGYAYHDVDDKEGVLHVLDLKRTDVGYLLGNLEAFRLERRTDPETGKRTLGSKSVGSFGREGGVRRILGFRFGRIEMRRASDTGGS